MKQIGLKCDRCGLEYWDPASVLLARKDSEKWSKLCNGKPRGLEPCPILGCQGEMLEVSKESA